MIKLNRLYFILIIFSGLLHGQSIKQCKYRFDTYLNFRGSLNNLVKFDNESITILSPDGKKEFVVYAGEIDMLADFFEHTSYVQQEQLLKLKGTKKYSRRQRDSVWIYVDDRKKLPKKRKGLPLQGYRVALDPGHFGTTLSDAQVEQKFLYFLKDSANGQKDSVKLFESTLTFNTARLIQKMLEEQGASVMLTRSENNFTSFGCTYYDWIRLYRPRVLDSLKKADVINPEKALKLQKANESKFFWDFFRDYELANRAKKMNEFNPHVSAIIHYNVDEKNEPWKKPSDKNFTMTFVGGAFTSDNFDKPETRIHFLRLLLTKQLNLSEKLASATVNGFNKNLNIAIAEPFDAKYLKDNSILTPSKGVYARNLVLCRLINSPLVYGEALYQDNEIECKELMKNDLNKFGLQTNLRLYKTAISYYNAIYHYLRAL